MTNVSQLAEQHIREHESRLKHIDELLEHAHAEAGADEEIIHELDQIRQEREKLVSHINELKQKSFAEWQVEKIEQSGPMVVWDAVAKKLEKLVERII